MNAGDRVDDPVSTIAAAIGEPARARILYRLVDGQARTATELSLVAGVSPSTTSVHLERLKAARLVNVMVRGKHRFYSLAAPEVARALEGLSVVAGRPRGKLVSSTPSGLRMARTCYDHMAGTVGVVLHDRLVALQWLSGDPDDEEYDLTAEGEKAVGGLGIDVCELRALRRRFAYPCLDWSERRPHLGGALGAALLELAVQKRWVTRRRDSRALNVTSVGRREMFRRFRLQV